MARTWTFQDDKQVKKLGTEAASWYVGWIDPEGKRRSKSCGPGARGQRDADKEADRIRSELNTGTYQAAGKKTWKEFRREYEERIVADQEAATKALTLGALAAFERLVKPGRVATISTQAIDDFIRLRRKEKGKKPGSTLSEATVNRDLRHLRAALTVAVEWDYLEKRPRFRMLREKKKAVTFVTAEHFALVYGACDEARMPHGLTFPVGDWWRGLLVMGYMTGWRISELLALRRDDLDLAAGVALTCAEDNKGERDDKVKLHPVLLDHLSKLASFTPTMFPWPHGRKTLDTEFHRIQRTAGINLHCQRRHEHTDACHVYGFHDLRRAFATQNAPRLTGDALQKLMRHKSYSTTQRYIAMASQVEEAVEKLHVPDVLKGQRRAAE